MKFKHIYRNRPGGTLPLPAVLKVILYSEFLLVTKLGVLSHVIYHKPKSSHHAVLLETVEALDVATLSDRVTQLHVSPIRRVAALLAEANARRELISFGGGAPSLPPPKEVSEQIIKLVSQDSQGATVYSGTKGYLDLRSLVADDWAKRQGEVYDPESEVMLTDGATEAIYAAFQSLLNKNDEVLITDPSYLGYLEAAQLAGGRVVRLPVSVEQDYQPDLELTKSYITRRTKVVLLLSPDNPTGRIVESDYAKGLLDLAIDNDFWIIYDATYRDIVYGERGKAQPRLTSFPGAHERVIALGSFSKEASVPGLRLGYVLGPKKANDAIEKIKQYTSLAPNTLSQRAMVTFLSGDTKERYLRDFVIPTYTARRDFMVQAIAKYLPDAKTVTPDGAFYFFVDMRKYLTTMQITDEQFCSNLTKQKSVIAIPGSFFGEKGVGHIRLTFVSEPEERLDAGMKRIGEFVFSYAFAMTN
ncbi:MAG TPA: pyridoxal phosphate-dependent aminotransferase [Candidatus Acidoferrales bacterium]|nr:pyridoxal phosphate-dependent aminotransferase [Candidatus Acidoferrales bacterium]